MDKRLGVPPYGITQRTVREVAKMDISYSKVKKLLKDYEDAQYGAYIDLEKLFEHLAEKGKEMDGEEAVLQFLDELSRAD